MKPKFTQVRSAVLLVAGSLLVLVGSSILVSPAAFYAANDIELGASVSLLNEIKAPAGFLLVAGLFMTGAVFMRQHAGTALWFAALIYLSYAGSRLLSMALDGLPATGLVQAAALESLVGIVCLAVLAADRNQPAKVA